MYLSKHPSRSCSSRISENNPLDTTEIEKLPTLSVDNNLGSLGFERAPNSSSNSKPANTELVREITAAESELKVLNKRYEALLEQSKVRRRRMSIFLTMVSHFKGEKQSKRKSEIRKEVIDINDAIKAVSEKLYVFKKKEKFVTHQHYFLQDKSAERRAVGSDEESIQEEKE